MTDVIRKKYFHLSCENSEDALKRFFLFQCLSEEAKLLRNDKRNSKLAYKQPDSNKKLLSLINCMLSL